MIFIRVLLFFKKIWKVFFQKYDTEEVGSMKYACGWFFKFKMNEEKLVVDQSNELQMLAHKKRNKVIQVKEQMQVADIINKLRILERLFQMFEA